jgi:hypothetical protein
MREEIGELGRHLIMLNAYTLGSKDMLPIINKDVNKEVERVFKPDFIPGFHIMRDPRFEGCVYGSSQLSVDIQVDLGENHNPQANEWYVLNRYVTVNLLFTDLDKVPNFNYLNKNDWLNIDNPLHYWAKDNALQIAKTWKTANRLGNLFCQIVNSCNTVGVMYSWMPETFKMLAEQMQSDVLRSYVREPKPVDLTAANDLLGVPDAVKALRMMHLLMVKGLLLRSNIRDDDSNYFTREIGRLRGDISVAYQADLVKPVV